MAFSHFKSTSEFFSGNLVNVYEYSKDTTDKELLLNQKIKHIPVNPLSSNTLPQTSKIVWH
jgi:hypothetical protein